MKLYEQSHARHVALAFLFGATLIGASALRPGQAPAFGPGYEGPLRFESEGAPVQWRDTPDAQLQSISAGHAVFEVGVGKGGKLAYRLGMWVGFKLPQPVEGMETIAGDRMRGFNFPFRFRQTVAPGLPASGLFWTPWTQCSGGGNNGDLCASLDLEKASATSGSAVTWGHMNRTAGPTGKAVFGPDDTFEINVMALGGLAKLTFSDTFPWPDPAN